MILLEVVETGTKLSRVLDSLVEQEYCVCAK